MFTFTDKHSLQPVEILDSSGYRPATLVRLFNKKKYSKVVELCRQALAEGNRLLSVRLVYARALYHAGQIDSAKEEFHTILSIAPRSITALKYVGDLKYADGDTYGAINCYEKIWEIDPAYENLCNSLAENKQQKETTTTITLKRNAEQPQTAPPPLKDIPFYTETMGDLYFHQGHYRLAREVFSTLSRQGESSRFINRLHDIEQKIKEKEKAHVKKTD